MSRVIRVVTAGVMLTLSFGSSRLASQTSTGLFDLDVQRSTVLKLGKSHVATVSAIAIRTDKYLGGRTNAIEIHMYAVPIDSRARERLSKNEKDEGALTAKGAGYFVLLVDKDDRITQASVTVTVPGTTVARTVAYTQPDIAKWFSDYRYSNGQLHLTSKGTYATGADPKDDKLTLSWDIALDIPVVDRVPPKGRP